MTHCIDCGASGTEAHLSDCPSRVLHVPDPVNHPPYYTSGKVECIDALEAATQDLRGIQAVCTANAIKYLWRWKAKNGRQDLQKARWYIDKLIKELK
jgi:Protein of unknwon function (DUF3310)